MRGRAAPPHPGIYRVPPRGKGYHLPIERLRKGASSVKNDIYKAGSAHDYGFLIKG